MYIVRSFNIKGETISKRGEYSLYRIDNGAKNGYNRNSHARERAQGVLNYDKNEKVYRD